MKSDIFSFFCDIHGDLIMPEISEKEISSSSLEELIPLSFEEQKMTLGGCHDAPPTTPTPPIIIIVVGTPKEPRDPKLVGQ